MRKSDILHLCLQNLLRRKSRTFLTVLGVLIGCCSIVIMVSIGIGMNESQQKMLSQMGDLTIITVYTQGNENAKQAKLNDEALRAFKSIPNVAAATPKLSLDFSTQLFAGVGNRYGSWWCSIIGIDADAIEPMGYALESGRSIEKSGEVLAGRYLAYNFYDTMRPEGYNMVDRWSGDFDEYGNPINMPDPFFDAGNMTMSLEVTANDGTTFTVPLQSVGLMKEDYVKGYETSEGLIMSLEDMKEIIKKVQGSTKKEVNYSTVIVKADNISKVAEIEKAIKKMGYSTSSMESIREPMEKEARQKQLMLGGLGAISLFVAALGITNTMIMSISERTREIGIMKSLGCYVRDIRVSFLAEAGTIGLIGGIVGCIVSFIASVTINMVSLKLPLNVEGVKTAIMGGEEVSRVSVIPPWLLLFAIGFSIVIGLGSGFYPANKAVRVPALEAIKYE